MDEPWEEIDALVGDLRIHDMDPHRAERIRARCVASLAQRRSRTRPRQSVLHAWLEPVLALSIGGLYLLMMAANAFAALR